METFQQRLLFCLGASGLKKKEVADRLGIAPQSMTRYIREGVVPQHALLMKMAKIFGVSADWLLAGKDSTPSVLHVAEATSLYRSHDTLDLRVLRVLEDLTSDDEKKSVLRCAELLRTGDRQIRHHLIGQLELLEDAARLRKARRPKRGHHGEEGGAAAG